MAKSLFFPILRLGEASARSGAVGGGSSGAVADDLAMHFNDEREQVVVFHVLDLVGQQHEAPIDFVQFAALERVAQRCATNSERVAAGVLA